MEPLKSTLLVEYMNPKVEYRTRIGWANKLTSFNGQRRHGYQKDGSSLNSRRHQTLHVVRIGRIEGEDSHHDSLHRLISPCILRILSYAVVLGCGFVGQSLPTKPATLPYSPNLQFLEISVTPTLHHLCRTFQLLNLFLSC